MNPAWILLIVFLLFLLFIGVRCLIYSLDLPPLFDENQEPKWKYGQKVRINHGILSGENGEIRDFVYGEYLVMVSFPNGRSIFKTIEEQYLEPIDDK